MTYLVKSKLRNFALTYNACLWLVFVQTTRDWIDTLGPPWNAKPKIVGYSWKKVKL